MRDGEASAKKHANRGQPEGVIGKNSVLCSEAGEGRVILRCRLAFDEFQARALPGASLADSQAGEIRGADWKGRLMRR